MNDALSKLSVEKKDRIINSALEEFSLNGYKNASTNNIVKNAEISKGSLFNYFGNKKQLYHKLEEFVVTSVREGIKGKIDWSGDDFFERINETVRIKLELTLRYPYIYEFFKLICIDKTQKEITLLLGEEMIELSHKIYTHNINFDLFKDGLDVKKVMNIINWSFEKLGEENWEMIRASKGSIEMDKIVEHFNGYLELLKSSFYK